MKKSFRPRVATIIICIIIAYVVIMAWNYFHKGYVTIYEVNETSIADDSAMTGFILRQEEVIHSKEGGFVNFYHADQSKIAKNEVIYTVDKSGAVSDLLGGVKSDAKTSQNDIEKMREVIEKFYLNYNPAQYYQIQDFHYNVENTIFEQSRDNLYSDLKKQMNEKNISGDFTKSRAKVSGVISYSIDGYEDSKLEDITPETFQNANNVNRHQLRSSEEVEADTPICKLVTDDQWSIVVPLTDSLYEKIKDSSALRITIKKDNVSFNANVAFHTSGGTTFAVLSTSRFMGRYLNDRFLDIELNLNAASGYKIPNSSIITKDLVIVPEQYVTMGDGDKSIIKLTYGKDGSETMTAISLEDSAYSDGKYYVHSTILKQGDTIINPKNKEPQVLLDVSSELGVYCVNTGYCKFRKIEKIYENNEYTIVSPDTAGGLSNYDHIVVNPEKISENDFVE